MRVTFVAALALAGLLRTETTAHGRESTADGGRLRREVIPTFEALRLVVDADRPDYSGSAHIDLQATRTVRQFRFHARDMALNRIVLTGSDGPIETTLTSGERGLVTLTAARPMAPGGYRLDIEFSNRFATQGVGLYRVEAGGRGYLFTQFEAADARMAFPCWDEPGFKIPWQLTLVIPPGHRAISNTAVVGDTVTEGYRTVVFARTPPLSSYLLAIATGPLETVAVPGLSIPTRVVTVAGQSSLAAEAVRLTPPIVRTLEEFFGEPYPYDKLDLIAVPEFWSAAMENAGAVAFDDGLLLLGPGADTFERRAALAQTLAHELAHMWFGDLVTMAWWDDLWLKESFASWMEEEIVDRIDPEFRTGLAQVQHADAAMLIDAQRTAPAVRRQVGAFDDLDQQADDLVYAKGSAVLAMFERWVGPETFRRGVIDYLRAHRHGTATAADFLASLSRAAGKNVSQSMSSFLDRPGVPLVSVESLRDGRIRLRQERFHDHAVGDQPGAWRIPVVLKFSDGQSVRTHRVLLTQEARTVTLDPDRPPIWIYPNAGERGYYRWRVSPEQLLALAQNGARTLEPRERIGFLGNLSALLDAGDVTGGQFMSALDPFTEDPEPQVILSLMIALKKIRSCCVPEGTAGGVEDEFAAYVRRMLAPAAARFGMSAAPGEDGAIASVRPGVIAMLADEGKDAKVLEEAGATARSYLDDSASVDSSLVEALMRVSALRGDLQLFRRYTKEFEAAVDPSARSLFLAALGGFRDPPMVDRVLEYALDGPLRPQEVIALGAGLGGNDRILDRRLAWMMENYAAIRGRLPDDEAVMLVHLAGGCSMERLAAARAFFSDPAHSPVGTDVELARVAEEVGDCVALRERAAPSVARYLHSFH
jgi:aminopeptidase N